MNEKIAPKRNQIAPKDFDQNVGFLFISRVMRVNP